MSKFDQIRSFNDNEVNEAIISIAHHPMMKELMHFAFPDLQEKEWLERLKNTHSIQNFQANFIYDALLKVLEKSSDGLTTSGFEKLDPNTPYFFISNHRDIILDTSLLNFCLYEHGLIMTASAIGDNLVKKPFLYTLSKINRNFLVKRGLSPRGLLESSKLMSEYIYQLLFKENRSVWIAQREGRTKDGNDATHPGVLKMIGMASDEENLMHYFKKLKIVPVTISYEYDPTDALKIPQIMAEANDLKYIKEKNEDFITMLNGIMGQKKRIHIHVSDVLENELDILEKELYNSNKKVQILANTIDKVILSNYLLWPTNYIAFDLLHKTDKCASFYTKEEKMLFERRMAKRIDKNSDAAYKNFLAMYANPVLNTLKHIDII